MSNFPENPIDGALAEVANTDGSAVQYKYDKAEAAWKIVGKIGGNDLQVVTTKDVVTTSEPPLTPAGWTGFNVQEDIQYLTNQKLVNWFLAEQIIKNHNRPPIISPGEPIQHPELPGTPDLINGDIWVDSNNNIYIYLNGDWVGIVRSDDFIADQERQDNGIDNIEQLQRELHTIVSESVYFYPGFTLAGQLPSTGEYLPYAYTFTTDGAGNERPTYFLDPAEEYEAITHMRISAVGGQNAHLERAEVGDTMYIQHIGTDAGGKYTITEIVPISGGPNGYFEIKVDFVEGFSDGNIEHPGYDQIQIAKPNNNDGDFVKKAGDTMTGNLVMDDSSIVMVDGPLDFVRSAESLKDTNGDPDLNASGEEQWDPNAERFSKIESYPPRLIKSDGTYSGDTSAAFGIRVELDDGNTFKNQFRIGNRNGDSVTIAGGTGPAVTFGSGFPGNQDKVAPGDEGKVRIKGIPTPDFETADGDVAVNKRYVDERDEVLRQDIIELEEEIDAIAPSVERGKWRFTAVGTVANPGQFTMYDAEFGSGNPTGLFKNAKSIWFNEVDTDGVTHAFGDVDDGELLEIFVEGAPEYGLYEVVGQAHDETVGATSFWVIDVNFVRTIEDTAAVAPNEVCRFKVFMAPTGGDASGFVMKSGDTMSGQLKFYTEQADDSFDYRVPTDGSKDIRFTTKRLDLGFENTTSLYKPGYTDTLVCSGALMSKSSLYTSSYLYGIIFKNDGTRVTKAPRIYFNRTVDSNDNVTEEFGALRWNGTNILRWDEEEITIDKPINITNNALATDGQHAIHRGYVDKVARMAGLQLGRYLYRRNSDNWVAGSIKSNTSTNPAAITKLSIYKSNHDGITFGASFLANLIVPGMFLHFMEKQEGIYCGKITDVSIITNGVEVILEPFTSLISGGVYLNNPYDVLISYNRYGIKFPQ